MPVARSRRVACAAAVITCVMLAAAGGPAAADTTPAPTTPGPNPAAQVVLTQADLPAFTPGPNSAQNGYPFPPCSQGNALIGGLGSSPNAVNWTDFEQASTNAQGSTNNFLIISSAALGADTVDQAHATFTVLASATFLSCIAQQARQYYNSTSLSVTLTPQPSHSPSTGDESTDLRLNLAGTWPDGEPLTAVLDFTVIRIQKMIALLEVSPWAVTGQDQPFPDGEVKLLDGLLASLMTSLQAPSPTGPTSGPGQTTLDCNPHGELDLSTAVEVPGFKALGNVGLSLSAAFTVGKVQICDHDMTPAASPPNDSHPLTLQVGGGLPTGAAATPGPNYAWLFHPFDYSLIHAAWTGPGVNLPSHLAPTAPKLELGPTITLTKGAPR
jgi:hypothetical protein